MARARKPRPSPGPILLRFLFAFLIAESLSAQGVLKPSPSPQAGTTVAAPAEPRDREWFEGHKADPSFGAELLRSVRAMEDPGQAGLLLMDYYGALKEPVVKAQAASWLAALCELQGRWDLAAQWYAASLEAREDPDARLSHALSLAKAGLISAALESLGRLPPASAQARGRGRILKAWSLAASGRGEDAKAQLKAVLEDGSLTSQHPAALYLAALLEGAAAGSAEKGSPSKEALLRLWPGSPEALALSTPEGRVSLRHDPLFLLSSLPSLAGLSAPGPSPEASPGRLNPVPSPVGATPRPTRSPLPSSVASSWPLSYQVGYFSKIDNARRLQAELKGKGYDAQLTERKARDGSPRWIVSVASGADPETLFLSLNEAGYDLYPLYD